MHTVYSHQRYVVSWEFIKNYITKGFSLLCDTGSAFQQGHNNFHMFTERACLKLMKVLIAIQNVHPYSFSNQFVLPPILEFCYKKITDPEAYVSSFDRFLIRCMILFKSVLECKEYKSSNTGRVVGDNIITLEQAKNNIAREAEDILKSLMVSEHVVLLCNVLIRRYADGT